MYDRIKSGDVFTALELEGLAHSLLSQELDGDHEKMANLADNLVTLDRLGTNILRRVFVNIADALGEGHV